MNLGVFINQAFYTDGKKVSTELSFVRFIESFSVFFEKIYVFAPTQFIPDESHAYYTCSDKITLVALPYYDNVNDMVKRLLRILPATSKALKSKIGDCDVIWLVGPHPLGLLAFRIAKKAKVPLFYHIRGNILKDVQVRYRGLKSIWAKCYARLMHWASLFLSHHIPILVVGQELFDLYRKSSRTIFKISPSLISQQDIETSRNRILAQPYISKDKIRLLFVGRPEPEKGLEYLFKAMAILNSESKTRYCLTIVGEAQRGSKEKEAVIQTMIEQTGMVSNVEWAGYIPFGDELLDVYRNSDIFILPSLAEGIPKVIYEAMAAGLPIIATRIGGLADVISDGKNGILISPGAVNEIVNAINKIVGDKEYMLSLKKASLQSAAKHTNEKARDHIMDILSRCEILPPLEDMTKKST